MALSADSAITGATTSRILNKLAYAMANKASDITTATTSDILLMLDASADYELKYADSDNVAELLGASTSDLTKLSNIDATAAEIDRATDVSGRLVAAGSTLSVTEASHDGKTILLDTATGSVCDLPSATGSGARFRFVVSVARTSNSHIVRVAASTDDEFVGHVYQVDTDSSDAIAAYPALDADGFDTITLDGTDGGADIGDVIEVEDIKSGTWALVAHLHGSGTVGTPLTANISS